VDLPGQGETVLKRTDDYAVLGVVTGIVRVPGLADD
jgi:hypothetical protein